MSVTGITVNRSLFQMINANDITKKYERLTGMGKDITVFGEISSPDTLIYQLYICLYQ